MTSPGARDRADVVAESLARAVVLGERRLVRTVVDRGYGVAAVLGAESLARVPVSRWCWVNGLW